MAERRMFAKTIVLSDAFLDMPLSARCLYFTLGMLADDDGFVNSPKSIMRQAGASTDDLNLLMAKRFILAFDSGVIVIKHWRIHNYIQKDRYKESKYMEEKATLMIDQNGAYTECIQDVSTLDTQVRLGKDRDRIELGEGSVGEDAPDINVGNKSTKHKYGAYKNVLLTDEDMDKLQEEFPADWSDRVERLSEYIASTGKKYKSHYATILNWSRKEIKEPTYKKQAVEPEWLNKEIKKEENTNDEIERLYRQIREPHKE
jgi:hypothetical protein